MQRWAPACAGVIGLRYLAFLLFVTLLSACSEQQTPSPKYFPLNAGFKWTYDVSFFSVEGAKRDKMEIINKGETAFGTTRTFLRSTSYGTDYLIQADKTGIYRVAKRILTQSAPEPDKDRRYVLRKPYKSGGENWSSWTRLYTMRFIPPQSTPAQSLFYQKPFLMSFSIEEENETVTVPAGTFENCLKVVGVADLTVYLDAKQGFVEIPITTNEWYAPGVGLVKLERIEDVDSGFYIGGRYNLELRSYQQD